MYTDSHCHITCDRLYSRIDEIIENIKAKNLTSCMIMCTSPEELERAKKVKEKYPFFKIAFGWFPSDAKEVADKEIQYLIDQTVFSYTISIPVLYPIAKRINPQTKNPYMNQNI